MEEFQNKNKNMLYIMFDDKVNVYINSKNRAANEAVSHFNVLIPDSLLVLVTDIYDVWIANVSITN